MSDGSTNWGSAIMLILQGEYVQFSKTSSKQLVASARRCSRDWCWPQFAQAPRRSTWTCLKEGSLQSCLMRSGPPTQRLACMQEIVQIAYQKIAKTIKCRDFLWNGSSSCFSTCWPCLWQFTKGQIRRWPGMLAIMMLTQLWIPTALIVERDKVRIWRDYYRRHQQILFWGTSAKNMLMVFFPIFYIF